MTTATATRATKQATITREIRVSADDAPWGRTVHASIFERKVLKTKTVLTSDVYTLERIPSDFGLAVRVNKQLAEGESYDVCLNMPGGGHSCDCPHGTYKGHVKPCRHIEAALQAVREKLI
jgi:hypothetical protein